MTSAAVPLRSVAFTTAIKVERLPRTSPTKTVARIIPERLAPWIAPDGQDAVDPHLAIIQWNLQVRGYRSEVRNALTIADFLQ
jgi:hypothetical protein